jgi:hypothetical protein
MIAYSKFLMTDDESFQFIASEAIKAGFSVINLSTFDFFNDDLSKYTHYVDHNLIYKIPQIHSDSAANIILKSPTDLSLADTTTTNNMQKASTTTKKVINMLSHKQTKTKKKKLFNKKETVPFQPKATPEKHQEKEIKLILSNKKCSKKVLITANIKPAENKIFKTNPLVLCEKRANCEQVKRKIIKGNPLVLGEKRASERVNRKAKIVKLSSDCDTNIVPKNFWDQRLKSQVFNERTTEILCRLNLISTNIANYSYF